MENKKKPNTGLIILIVVGSILLVLAITVGVVIHIARKTYSENQYNADYEVEDDHDIDDIYDDAADIDLDGLKEAAEKIGDLDLGGNSGIDHGGQDGLGDDFGDDDLDDNDSDEDDSEDAGDKDGQGAGDLIKYSYADVYKNGNDLRVVPNGGLNGSTVLMKGKDLEGLLDYVESKVLEPGRTINRDFFYGQLAVMLVDEDMMSDTGYVEKSIMMALAVANNFHDTPVTIRECSLDAGHASDYHYEVTAYGKDDTWIIDYEARTVYFNNGKTEYSSDMFKDDYLAVWFVAIEDYYGIK
ncbi:MAG: hypothetical protein K6F34_01400 [Lachnospiraceae bacterium]|nr:hypothetical protein [Lachnospiraceae bacterium]